ncbi:MAG TPA: molecular chaperone DnaJ [Egibacteraceae bacterium]|nr:molecular chaperone DnaJ [Egibacteraceae bacterium]
MSQRDYFEKDYYATLGVARDASQAEIAKAYRKLARELHPDANPGDKAAEERFKEVSEAYSVLSSTDKRAEYDEVRRLVSSGGFRGGFPGGGPGGGFRSGAGGYTATGQGFEFDLGDLLGGIFGGGAAGGRRGAGGPRRGRDVETELTLSFSDALRGVTTTLRLSGAAPCSTCAGSGARPGTAPVPCATCGGAGTIAQDQGLFSFSEPCPACGGSGRQIPNPCANCKGSGVESRTREIRARIPAGVKDGATIRLKGKGEPGRNGAPAGDLLVKVHVQPHTLFGRRGDDLTIRVPITFAEAALGAKVSVPTLDGPVTVRIPGGTESGKTFRVRGKGVERDGRRGDLLVSVDVAVPRKLTREQRKLLEQLADTQRGDDVRAHLAEVVQ